MYTVTVSDRVRALRRKLRMTQAELAERALVAPSTVALLETGAHKPRQGTAERIAAALGVTVHELIG